MNPHTECIEDRIVALFESIHHLDRIPRAGYVVRGVPHPESVSAHSHFVSILTVLFLEQFPDDYDREKAIVMAIIHDLSEAKLMDIPMPYADSYLKKAKEDAEQAIFEDMFSGFDGKFSEYHREMLELSSPEARLVRGLDKVQLLLKVLYYERERAGYLEEFWTGAMNFRDYGIKGVSDLFDAICAKAGRVRPKPVENTP